MLMLLLLYLIGVYISNGNMSGWIFRSLIDGNAKTVESTSMQVQIKYLVTEIS